jgi:hypothetical protein
MISVVVISYANAECTSVKLPDDLKTTTAKWENCEALGDAKFFWNYDTTTFTCAIVVPRGDGWVGVGFRKEEKQEMWGADIYVGFIDSSGKKKFKVGTWMYSRYMDA